LKYSFVLQVVIISMPIRVRKAAVLPSTKEYVVLPFNAVY